MAAKSKPKAAKAAPKKKAPAKKSEATKAVERKTLAVEQVGAYGIYGPDNSAIVLVVDGTEFTLSEQALLKLQRDVNELALGFNH